MTELSLRPYTPADAEEWDAFVRESKNATFLLQRGYMDYHSDRFTDASLIIERGGRTAALFAASRSGNRITAHGGLTYGGFIMPMKGMDGADMLAAARMVAEHYRRKGAYTLIYKAIPYIYHRNPADEDLYALFRLGAVTEACGLSSAIDLRNNCGFNENSRRNCRRALAAGVTVAEDNDALTEFHAMLADVLAQRHNTAPVHSDAELHLLRSRFPENIRLFTARNAAGRMIAGTLIYFTGRTAHAQYIAASPLGRELRALPALFSHIIEHCCAGLDYFDFGISTEQGGEYLNTGLHHQKYSMGGRGVVYNILRLNL